jgi:hypothetical protein
MKRFLPLIVSGIFLVYLVTAIVRPVGSTGGFDVAAFGRLPVLLNGRLQPLDSVARLALLQIRGTVAVPLEKGTLDATVWLVELLMKPEAADKRKIFLVREPQVSSVLHRKPEASSGVVYYTYKELEPRLEDLTTQTRRIASVKAADRAPWERECLKVRNALTTYERLKNSLQPNGTLQREAGGKPIAYDFAARLARYQTDLRAGLEAAVVRERGNKQELDPAVAKRIREFAEPYVAVSRTALISMIPPTDPVKAYKWQNVGMAVVDGTRTGQLPPPLLRFAAMSSAVAHGKAADFDREVAKYNQWLTARGFSAEVSKARSEYFFTHFQPFVRAAAIYLVAFILICASWVRRSTMLRQSATILVIVATVLHTTGLLFGMMLEGRPPITNWYSLIILVGWMAAVAGLVAERYYRNGIGVLTTAAAGLAAMLAAYILPAGGAIALIQAVLDRGFVLAALATAIVLSAGTLRGAAARLRLRRRRAPRRAEAARVIGEALGD